MTGPEVTAAMEAEGVDAALVEKFANALGLAYVAEQMPEYARNLRLGLAAVLPEIQAQALRDAADVALLDRWSGWKWVAEAVSAWLRARAARLTATTEEPTT